MIRGFVARLYKSTRGHELGEVPSSVLLTLLTGKLGQAARGARRGLGYRAVQQPHFVGRRVSLRNSRSLSVGKAVVFNSDTTIECFGVDGITLGDRVTVGSYSSLMASTVVREPGRGITVGNNTAIGIRNTIWGQGGVVIGNDCLLGPDVFIVSENHTFDSRETPILAQGGVRDAVTIGDDCWLGAGVKIMPGVTIGDGAVIGAGAVVTKSVPAYSIAAGIPARVMGTRP